MKSAKKKSNTQDKLISKKKDEWKERILNMKLALIPLLLLWEDC